MISVENGKMRKGVASRIFPRVWPVMVMASRLRRGRSVCIRATMPPAL